MVLLMAPILTHVAASLRDADSSRLGETRLRVRNRAFPVAIQRKQGKAGTSPRTQTKKRRTPCSHGQRCVSGETTNGLILKVGYLVRISLPSLVLRRR